MYIPSGKIYVIRNDLNNRVYVGQTRKSLNQRFKNHIRSIPDGSPIHRAMQIYGVEHFNIELLEECPVEKMDEKERAWIIMLRAFSDGYNESLGGAGKQKYLPDIIWRLLKEGKQVSEVCKLVGCGKDTVYGVANAHEFTVSPKSTKKKTFAVTAKKDGFALNFSNVPSAAKWVHNTIRENVSEANIARTILRCLRGKRKTAYGYKWNQAIGNTRAESAAIYSSRP